MNEVGEKLKQTRIEKGLTLDDLQQTTKIQKRYLIAIEDGHFESLPGDFYVRAFVKQYADTVGLNGDDLLREYSNDIPKTKPEELAEKANDNSTRTSKHITSSSHLEAVRNYLPTVLVVLVGLAIVGVMLFFIINNRSDNNKSMINQSSSIAVSDEVSKDSSGEKTSSKAKGSSKAKAESESKAKAESESKAKAESESKAKAAPEIALASETNGNPTFTVKNAAKTNTLIVKSTGRSWTTINKGDTAAFAGILEASNPQTIALTEADTSVTVRLGNANVITMELNGKEFNFNPNNVNQSVKNVTINFEQAAS